MKKLPDTIDRFFKCPSLVLCVCFWAVVLGMSIPSDAATAYSEFYTQTTGSNANPGDTTADAAAVTYTGGTWVQSTSTFTPAGGANPTTDGLLTNRFVSLYLDSDVSGIATCIVRLKTVGTTTVVMEPTAFGGTIPADSVAGMTLKFGGAWKGPNGATGFPFNFVVNTMTNFVGSRVRVNMKGNADPATGSYKPTAAMTQTKTQLTFCGYNSTPGDLVNTSQIWAWIDLGGGVSYLGLTASAAQCIYQSLAFTNSFSSGTSDVVPCSGVNVTWKWCLMTNSRRCGWDCTGQESFIECGGKNNNVGNTVSSLGTGLYLGSVGAKATRWMSTNTASNAIGLTTDTPGTLRESIFVGSGKGVVSLATTEWTASNNIFYGLASDAIDLQSSSATAPFLNLFLSGNLFFKNGGWAVKSATTARNGWLVNNFYGSGTMTNTSGNIQMDIPEDGAVNYTTNLTPWIDPANGDFRESGGALTRAAGRGSYLVFPGAMIPASIGYPDAGALQAQPATTAYTFGN